ncbi:type II secretion system (T2SS) protein F [Haloactinopolyspora alba]|uniref:Type II secretion system (T2SS) protein F n=1 Tax=Haloactinopolyspora alba TaxID=648780 RepID=A0A2P8E753_9ACTN|nr:type II secretion system F family protein [Haloactinopolyspora alba]PSL05299.1 type II secretion system (T2SS) protein F [Haloactinopolyspora alba]
MISTVQLAILLGLGAGTGLILLFRELLGQRIRQPHAAHTAARLTATTSSTVDLIGGDSRTDRLGRVVLRRTSGAALLHIPHRDLALLRTSVARYLGERALYGAIGLALPPACTLALAVNGVTLPLTVPAGVGLVTGAAMSYLPLYNVADLARTSRREFRRTMTSYVDLVALERAAGAGTTQALESAATIADSWAFQRLRDELAQARWAGTPAWDALRTVGDELRLPELAETADVMRLSAREGAAVYDILRVRASTMRNEILTGDHARAGARTERATAPLAATSVVFMLILAAPVAMQIG